MASMDQDNGMILSPAFRVGAGFFFVLINTILPLPSRVCVVPLNI